MSSTEDLATFFERIEQADAARGAKLLEEIKAIGAELRSAYTRTMQEAAAARADAREARRESASAMAAVKELEQVVATMRCEPLTEPAEPFDPGPTCVHCELPESNHVGQGHAFRASRGRE
jgi:hypothetical protein